MKDQSASEHQALAVARAERARCVCGGIHADGREIACSTVARMRAHLATHPEHQFALDDEAGIVAVIVPRAPCPPEIIAWSASVTGLLDSLGAPSASSLS